MFTMGPPLRGGDSDPFFGSVRALFHLDNNLTDSSATGTVATSSNLAYSNSIVKSGFGFSGDFTHPSNSAVVTLPSAAALAVGSGDFTVEFWWYPTELTSGTYFLAGDGATSDIWFYVSGSSKLGTHILGIEDAGTGSVTLLVNTWHHIALARSGTTVRVFINGVLNYTAAGGSGDSGATAQWTLGSWVAGAGGGSGGRCYIDDFRLTVGAARYTSAFTPPAAPFPNA
jgi:hypothetical protein